jgi:hypothetical protein
LPAIVLAVAVLTVVAVHVVVDRLTREPQNYSQVDDGLWLGGYVAEPPPGTNAVLNLCESEDPYRVEAHRWQPIQDAEPVPSLDWLRDQVQFIEAEQAAGRGTEYIDEATSPPDLWRLGCDGDSPWRLDDFCSVPLPA